MAFEGGPLSVVGITPSFLTQLATQTSQTGVTQGLGQVWQGVGQSFAGSAGQALSGNLAGSAVNIALNSALGTQVSGPQGLSLSSGANILASTLTPYVTSNVAAGINQSIQQSLQGAGPFGPALSTLGTGLVDQAFNSITDSIFGATTGNGNGENYKSFPGGGGEGEEPADYSGGTAYTLGPNGRDVVFSIQPANQGPQAFGDLSGEFFKSNTTLPFNDFEEAINAGESLGYADLIKSQDMDLNTDFFGGDFKTFSTEEISDIYTNTPDFGSDIVGTGSDLLSFSTTFAPGGLTGAAPANSSWTFITAPEDISWDISNNTQRVEMFGTNGPPVVSGTRGMRDLQLTNALVEGFVRGVSIEGKVKALENLMNYKLNGSDGFVSVPVYQVWANEKSYGGSNSYYIIKDVRVKETMRDLSGKSTRAYVDVSFMEVPAYQVASGRDQASETTSGATSLLESDAIKEARNKVSTDPSAASTQAAQAQGNQGTGSGNKPKSGAEGPTPPPPPSILPDQRQDLPSIP